MERRHVVGRTLRDQANVNLMGGHAFREQATRNITDVRNHGHHYSDAHVSRPIGHTSPVIRGNHQTFHESPSIRSLAYAHHQPSTGNATYSPHSVRGPSIVGERTEYIERQVPKRVVKEKKVKKKKVIPTDVEEEVQHDEVIEIKEKIIELASPSRNEEPQVIVNEIVKKRKVKKQEIIEKKVPRISYREKIVEVPEVEYVEVPVEKVVEIPQEEEKVVYEKVKVPQIVDRYYPVEVEVEQPVDVHRRIPVPVEATQAFTFELPTLKPKYKRKELPIYAPRFVEVPVPAELMDHESQELAIHLREQIHLLASQEAPSLVEVEKIARFAKEVDFQSHISGTDYQVAIENAWRNKQLTVQNRMLQSVGHEVGASTSPPGVTIPVFGVPK